MPYLTPEEMPEGDDCRPLSIPASSEWLAIVSGALTELTKTWNWEQQGSVTVQEAVDRMQLMVDEYYNVPCANCELPEGGSIIRQNGSGEFEQLVDGDWVEPQGDYELPPIPAREDPTPEERMCLAAKNAINVLKLLYEDMTDSYNLDLDPAVALTVWAGRTSTVVLVALGLLTFGTGTILFGVWTLLYQALEFLTEDVWSDDFDNKAVCALLLTATDTAGVVTFNWRNFMDNLAMNTDLGDPSIGELRLFGQIYYMLLILGSDGLNQAGATTGITDSDCSFCEPVWCLEWTQSQFEAEWTFDFGSTNGGYFVAAHMPFGSTAHVVGMECNIDFTPPISGGCADPSGMNWWNDEYTSQFGSVQSVVSGPNELPLPGVPLDIDGVALNPVCNKPTPVSPEGSMLITYVKMWGTGEPPEVGHAGCIPG